MKVCVFGASGFIGSAIVNELESAGLEWVGISRSIEERPNFIKASLAEIELLKDIIADYPYVINAMGSFKPKDFESDTKVVLQSFWNSINSFNKILSQSKVKNLLHISSGGTVYGESRGSPFKENDLLLPISWYGRAKVIEESIYEKQAYQCNFNYRCARVTNPFGNNVFSNHGFVDVLINSVKVNGVFNTFKSNGHYRDFIYAPDMAKVLINILSAEFKNRVEILNVGMGSSRSLFELVKLAKMLAPSLKVKNDYILSEYDILENKVDVKKLRNNGFIKGELKSPEDYIYEMLKRI